MFTLVPSVTGHEGDEEQLRWHRLYTQISEQLVTLKKVQEEHQTLISSEDGGAHGKVGNYVICFVNETGPLQMKQNHSDHAKKLMLGYHLCHDIGFHGNSG